VLAAAACSFSASEAAPPSTGSTGGGTVIAVLEHHAGPSRTGAYADPSLTRAAAAGIHLDPGFRASLPGAIYAQPLYVPGTAGGRDLLLAASERNAVGAFDPETGKALWTRTLAPPAPLSALPCGNIDPLGVTGTPVVDPATRTVFLDTMTSPDGGRTLRHLVYALSVDDGSTRPGWPVDVAATLAGVGQRFDASVQNQRGALALRGGRLYVPYSGFYGDCGDYRGWLVSMAVAQPSQVSAWHTGARGGGSWGPSGVASDGARIFLATGNTFDATTWSGGEAVLAFAAGEPPGSAPVDWFAPSNWQDLDAGDVDLGGSGPVLVDLPGATPSALAVALGKDGNLYLLDRNRLGGLGGALLTKNVSSSSIINAAAAYTTARGTYVVFRGSGVGCPSGGGNLTAARLVPGSPPRAEVAWCAAAAGRGSPIATTTDGTSEPLVWVVGAESDGKLRGFDGDTGAPVVTGPAASAQVRRFQSPIVSNGRVYVAVDGGVSAYRW
jgi:outer membrane protein assembly factor BamB